MTPPPDPRYRHRFPAEIIAHAVWLYHVFSLSLRDVKLLLTERGIVVSYENFRRWYKKFGHSFANRLRDGVARTRGCDWRSRCCRRGGSPSSSETRRAVQAPRRAPSSHCETRFRVTNWPEYGRHYDGGAGLIGSVIALLGLALRVPDHSTMCRRNGTLELPPLRRSGTGPS
jgi:putative transposase